MTRELNRLISLAAVAPSVSGTQAVALTTLKEALAGESDFCIKLLAVLMNAAVDGTLLCVCLDLTVLQRSFRTQDHRADRPSHTHAALRRDAADRPAANAEEARRSTCICVCLYVCSSVFLQGLACRIVREPTIMADAIQNRMLICCFEPNQLACTGFVEAFLELAASQISVNEAAKLAEKANQEKKEKESESKGKGKGKGKDKEKKEKEAVDINSTDSDEQTSESDKQAAAFAAVGLVRSLFDHVLC